MIFYFIIIVLGVGVLINFLFKLMIIKYKNKKFKDIQEGEDIDVSKDREYMLRAVENMRNLPGYIFIAIGIYMIIILNLK